MADLFLGGLVDPATHARTGSDLSIASDDLTTHGVIVGMTGSGKTGLGVVLVEEVLRSGLPALLIDPKGDLTNLCLTFPELRPDDFAPWVDAARASAADEAAAWRAGLGDWGLSGADVAALRERADFTIYTPGSRAGLSLDVVGSLQAPVDMSDPEVIADEIEGFVSGLLGMVGIDADPLASREHILLSNLINHEWNAGRSLDMATLVGMVGTPPIRKLGVFELDQFFPASERRELAIKLNGLLASPSFAAWGAGAPLDIESLLYSADGRARCAIVTTSHLSDEERQFVTALILSKLVTWMRLQSGTAQLRALLYMDEVAGYLPPIANPPTKRPIITLMKQARAFGVGVVLATQNPVDIDYKALSNAGTWMIGRLQTERDKQRLLDGLSSASGAIDVRAVAATISGLAKREFVLRRAGKDSLEVFTTRWAMSYLRGPLTRDQIGALMGAASQPPAMATPEAAPATTAAPALPADETPVMPQVAGGIAVRWVDPAAPWIIEAGGDARSTRYEPSVVARVRLRFDDTKADIVHDDEYECVLAPLTDAPDVSRAIPVDYDDRDLLPAPPDGATYRIVDADLARTSLFSSIERELRDHLVRNLTLELPANPELGLYGRPGESREAFADRCAKVADERADTETAKLRTKYEKKVLRLRDQLAAAQDRVEVLEAEAAARRDSELLSTAGSILGGLLGGRRRGELLGKLGSAANRRGNTRAARERAEAAGNKTARLLDELERLDAELAAEIAGIDARWAALAEHVTTVAITLERTDVAIQQIALAWLPS